MLPLRPSSTAVLRRAATALTLAIAVASAVTTATGPSVADAANPITPGNYQGLGFDQCNAPSQATMDTWLAKSPYRAIGIYISGDLRYCSTQANLTPTWVHTQLLAGWHLLPIHVGAQASCSTQARYHADLIDPSPTDDYVAARGQGRAEARQAVAAAQALGIVGQSTIFYDLEAFPTSNTACSTSALKFLSGWTNQLITLGYTSGVYSSGSSGIALLDQARQTPGNTIKLPTELWIGDWNGTADANSSYVSPDGWVSLRVHQYRGGHNETWGGVTINIDSDYLDVRAGPYTPPGPATPEIANPVPDARCTTRANNHQAYLSTDPSTRPGLHATLQCLLKQHGYYTAAVTGTWNKRTAYGVRAWQRHVGHTLQNGFTQRDWTSLLVAGDTRTWLTAYARGADVIRVQRALNAADSTLHLPITGVYDVATAHAVRAYQVRRGLPRSGQVTAVTWRALEVGRI
jgi:hypothetical protein